MFTFLVCQVADPEMRADITPKNILLIGPTGVGKTEIARRLAKHLDAPFVKVSLEHPLTLRLMCTKLPNMFIALDTSPNLLHKRCS